MEMLIDGFTPSNIEKIERFLDLSKGTDLALIINNNLLSREPFEVIEFFVRHLASYISSTNITEAALIHDAYRTRTNSKLTPKIEYNSPLDYDKELFRIITRRNLQRGLMIVDPTIGEKDTDILPDDLINKYLEYYQPPSYWWITKASEVNSTDHNVDNLCMKLGLFHFLHNYGKSKVDDLFIVTYKMTNGELFKPSVLNDTGPGWWPQINNSWGKTLNASTYCSGYSPVSNDGVCEGLHVFSAPLGDSAHAENISFPNDYIINWNQYILDKIEYFNILCK